MAQIPSCPPAPRGFICLWKDLAECGPGSPMPVHPGWHCRCCVEFCSLWGWAGSPSRTRCWWLNSPEKGCSETPNLEKNEGKADFCFAGSQMERSGGLVACHSIYRVKDGDTIRLLTQHNAGRSVSVRHSRGALPRAGIGVSAAEQPQLLFAFLQSLPRNAFPSPIEQLSEPCRCHTPRQ